MERIVGGVGVLDKAIAILNALSADSLSLAELSVATDIPKPTVHRLCSALEQHNLISRDADDRRRLGSKILQWASSASSEEDLLVDLAQTVMGWLRDETGESVQLYVRDGSNRRCISGLESPHGLRTIVQVGAVLSLDRGSAGKALSRPFNPVKGWVQSVEEREKGVASVSSPVVKNGEVVAAVSVSGPIDRLSRSPGKKYGALVQEAARRISSALV